MKKVKLLPFATSTLLFILFFLLYGSIFYVESKEINISNNAWLSIHGLRDALLIKNPIFHSLVRCIEEYASLDSNSCVRNLLLRRNSTSVSEFYTLNENACNQVCSSICDYSYRTSMFPIVNTCVNKVMDEMQQSISNEMNVTTLSEIIKSIGNSTIGFLKQRACLKNPEAPSQLCTVDFLQFTSKYKLLNGTIEWNDKPSLFILQGMRDMYAKFNKTVLDNIDAEVFCTKCNLLFLQHLEEYYASNIYPHVRSFPSLVLQRDNQTHALWVQEVNRLCGPYSMNNTLKF